MKKITYILCFTLLFLGCSKEPIDEIVTDDSIKGEPIVRFEINGITYGARANDVKSNYDTASGDLIITVNAKDEKNDFNRVYLSILVTSAEKGFYTWDYFSSPDINSTGIIRYEEESWFYMTILSYDPDSDRGGVTITEVNESAGQIEGYFSFELFPPPEDELNLPPDIPYPSPQKIENGYFKYIDYKD